MHQRELNPITGHVNASCRASGMIIHKEIVGEEKAAALRDGPTRLVILSCRPDRDPTSSLARCWFSAKRQIQKTTSPGLSFPMFLCSASAKFVRALL